MASEHRPGAKVLQIHSGLLLAAGVVVALAISLNLAPHWLREWRPIDLHRGECVRLYRSIAAESGVVPTGQGPRVRLTASASDLGDVGKAKGQGDAEGLAAESRLEAIEISEDGLLGGEHVRGDFMVTLSFDGGVESIHWSISSLSSMMNAQPAQPRRALAMANLLLRPGERLQWRPPQLIGGVHHFFYGELAAPADQHLTAFAFSGGSIVVQRHLGAARNHPSDLPGDFSDLMSRSLVSLGSTLPVFLLVCATFIWLLIRKRLSAVNGALLAAIALVSQAPPIFAEPTVSSAGLNLIPLLGGALWILIAWSAGESLLRASEPEFTTSLDALRRGRVGPRSGRSLLTGLAAGAALAALTLVLASAATAARGVTGGPSVLLPIFTSGDSPLSRGIRLAAVVMLVLGLSRQLLRPRWTAAAAIVAGAFVLPTLPPMYPYPAALAVTLIEAALLVMLARRRGLTALLSAALTLFLLPAALVSFEHRNWLAGSFAASALPLLALLLAGLAGLRRSEKLERERIAPPAFIRRLEDERRLKYEMELLSRMQLGLLPSELPQPPGWQIAATSILANEASGDLYDFLEDEAGRLWIAAGDVAGHGYSCSIVQAMTTAALGSLIGPDRPPSAVLAQIDRVLRRGGTRRNFTSLVLLRLNLATGEGLVGNAGHPAFWRLPGEGAPEEIELPGLPLGQGPARTYADRPLTIAPGEALVFCSDGLYESTNGYGEAYGYERPRGVLARRQGATAAAAVEALLDDWRSFLGAEAPNDDTTVLVVRRA